MNWLAFVKNFRANQRCNQIVKSFNMTLHAAKKVYINPTSHRIMKHHRMSHMQMVAATGADSPKRDRYLVSSPVHSVHSSAISEKNNGSSHDQYLGSSHARSSDTGTANAAYDRYLGASPVHPSPPPDATKNTPRRYIFVMMFICVTLLSTTQAHYVCWRKFLSITYLRQENSGQEDTALPRTDLRDSC